MENSNAEVIEELVNWVNGYAGQAFIDGLIVGASVTFCSILLYTLVCKHVNHDSAK